MGLIDAPNKVPEQQRRYQAAYKAHTRIWRISPRSPYFLTPYNIVLWGTTAATMYAMCRKIYGKNTWFSD
ncbi:hypothetical protein NEMBOFW57_005855 [Staphylotrichum longicolle]|uniref:Uncharacterized protein n=1 Tax=Staphylotrichum longicolle TaxID=669026 RepID=A0AAD4EXS7_9PEZI|nr:hypothetical protein NEMBOFW57_005855 [Staphylotrichum longicolle]